MIEDSPHVRAPVTWRSTVAAGKVGQPQPVSCQSTSRWRVSTAILVNSRNPVCCSSASSTNDAVLGVIFLSDIESLSVQYAHFTCVHRRWFRWFETGIRWLKGRLEKSQASEAVSAAVGWIKKRVDRKRRGASGKPVNVVPVLRPVTDCRLSDRLCPDQTGEW